MQGDVDEPEDPGGLKQCGLGFGAGGLGIFKLEGLGFRGLRVWDLRFRV